MTENMRKFLKMVWRRGEMDPEHAILVNIRGDTDIDVVLVKMSDKDVIPVNYPALKSGACNYVRDTLHSAG